MTDNDIIKALECCSMRTGAACSCCPYHQHYDRCITKRNADIADLINRQKAESDKLKKRLEEQKHALFEHQAYSAKLQAEIARLEKSNHNWRRKTQRLRAEKGR